MTSSQRAETVLDVAHVHELVELTAGLLRRGERRLLGITGTPGAGKSTVAAALVRALGDDAVLVGMDGFHLSNRQLERLGRSGRKGAPDTFDVGGYRALLTRIRERREDVYAPEFERNIEESVAAAMVVRPDVPLVVTEGNYLLLDDFGWAPVRGMLDAAWYIDVAAEERVRRLEQRRRSHGHDLTQAAGWVRDVDEPNAGLVEATRSSADLVVHVTTSPAVFSAVVAGAATGTTAAAAATGTTITNTEGKRS